MGPRRLLLLPGLLLLAACTGGSPDPDVPGSTAEPVVTSTPSAPASSEPTASVAPPTDTSPVPDDELPGEPWGSGPAEGAELAVVGVAAGDVLDVRGGPGVAFPALGGIEPLGTTTATGRSRMAEDAVWTEVTADGATGWANLRHLAYAGQVTDVTSELGALPAGPDLVALARAVAGDGPDGDAPPEVVVVDGPRVGDLAEVTVDVLGLADDAVLGSRLHVFAQPDGAGFTVRTVERTVLCARGVDDEGLCV